MGKLKRKKKTKLTAEQKRTLKLLGWDSTQEDGALLQHPNLSGDIYMWDFETFGDAVARVQVRLEELDTIVRNVRKEVR